MIIIYHNDPDGKCAAAIAYHHYKDKTLERIKFIEMDYINDIPFDEFNKNESVLILDFSLQKPGDWDKLFSITPHVIWIDHHKSAIEKNTDLLDLQGIRSIEKSGCELTWEYFNPGERTPLVVAHIGDYDTWKFNLAGTEVLFLAIKTKDLNPIGAIWSEWLSAGIGYEADIFDELYGQGKIIQSALYNLYNEIVQGLSYEIEWEGYKCIACNATYVGSKLYQGINKEKYDFLIVYRHSNKGYTISVYTEKEHDAAKLCQRFGGGGHKGAAGFQCKELPWLIK